MSILVYVVAVIGIWAFGFAAGWKVDAWKAEAARSAELEQDAIQMRALLKERDDLREQRDLIATRFETKLANLKIVNKTITNEVRHELEKTVYGNPECALPVAAVKLRNSAIDAANGEARPAPGKPDAAVPEAGKNRGASPAVPGADRSGPRGNQDVRGVRSIQASLDRRSQDALTALNLEN